MRIGIDCRLWNESGVGRYIRNLVKNLQELDKKNEYILLTPNIRWHTIGEQLFLPLILKKEKLDIVHFPYFSVPILYPGKFIVTIHDLIPLHFATGQATTLPQPLYKLKRLGYKFVIKKAAQKATKIITVSNATKEEIIKHLGVNEDKIVVTYEGASLASSNQRLATSSKITKRYTLDASSYFLYVGNAYPHKNLERLIEAFKFTQGSNTQLVLVGREDYFYKRLKEKVKRMKCRDNVIFYGEATDNELQSLYKNAKVLIIPSLMEGFGLPALEAMANRCLVLCSDIPALREVCGQSAIYFNPYDINDIANKMMTSGKVSGEEARIKMFSWEKLARETLKVYQSI